MVNASDQSPESPITGEKCMSEGCLGCGDVEEVLTDDAVVRPSRHFGNSDSSFPRGKFETRSQRSCIRTNKFRNGSRDITDLGHTRLGSITLP